LQQVPVQPLHFPQQGAASQPQAQRQLGSSQQQAASDGMSTEGTGRGENGR
jgi:hypothetical protein